MAHKYFGLNELREMFLCFFESKGHLRLPSFSLVPQHDDSILLINAGMTPMKTYFTGEEEPPRRRVCTCQKCIRTADIENIGKTARHGTYFEMLGNFSFGDYFKHEAIAWSWEFLTSEEWVGLEPDRLYPSIYMDDEEAFEIWNKEIGIPEERIFRFGKEDNFWEHGSGPCGPCSEIYYDRGPEKGCGRPECTVGCDCDRYIEVWNNVFSQFNNDGHGNYTELAQKNIDTGMGLERLACVCQNVDSLFDVDTVMNITNKVSELTGATYGQSHDKDVSLRIITDHIRSATFMIGDGILPSNEGRGYVLRRLLRRAARHGKLLGVSDPFLYKVCDTVIHENQDAYPELVEKQKYITRVIKVEEANFAKTIDGGMKILTGLIESFKKGTEKLFSGDDAFRLYDTYGFPIDLTEEILSEQGISVNAPRFNELMQAQKEKAREARKAMGDLAWAGIDLGLDNTPTQFTGYTNFTDTGTVLAIVMNDELCSTLREGQSGVVVLDRTPFYAEMGGQVADHGRMIIGSNVFQVTDVQKNKAGKYLHHGFMDIGSVSVDDVVTAEIDVERRKAIMRAHSGTHLLQKALQDILGDHVHQAGSYVEPDKLRFDFTHFSAVTSDELRRIDEYVNDMILDDLYVDIKEMPIAEAKQMGAMALFGEKYGDIVRVVNMGDKSIEFCGGTHVANTAKIGPFKIVSESSIASGVRRIEAITGKVYLRQNADNNNMLTRIADSMKAGSGNLLQKVQNNLAEMKRMSQDIEKLKDQMLSRDVDSFIFNSKNVGGLKVVTTARNDLGANELRRLGDFLRAKDPDSVTVLVSVKDGKITFLASCGKNAVARGVKAGELVKKVSAICGGSGGGRPDSAMGGGKDQLKIDDALASVDDFVAEKLGL